MWQQIVGIINLSLPVIGVFYMMPAFLDNYLWILAVSGFIGVYVWYLNYLQHISVIKRLLHLPSGSYKELFESWIRECNVDVATVEIKYAYTGDNTAMAMSNTILVDPMLCSLSDGDTGSDAVKNIYNLHIEPTLTPACKQRLEAYKKLLTPQAQAFIFKHELGHVVDAYSYKKLWMIFFDGTVFALAGILSAKYLMSYNVYLAVLVGMIVAGLVDVFLTYASNVLFKYQAEKHADFFAAQHSSKDEIQAAAHYFVEHEKILETYPDTSAGLPSKLPSIILSGHPSGKSRSAYLLQLAAKK